MLCPPLFLLVFILSNGYIVWDVWWIKMIILLISKRTKEKSRGYRYRLGKGLESLGRKGEMESTIQDQVR